jgi:cytidylate kinase
MVTDSDAARADYFRRFYHLDREQPTNYDVVFNTDVLTVEQAQAAVLALVGL